ncbi:hypothetical protein OF83DRAFT_1208117 [Amylostereum chailletii]|nr:hypothetical protein OF83DRAFT_1208117 [Amylostereum chailletii]
MCQNARRALIKFLQATQEAALLDGKLLVGRSDTSLRERWISMRAWTVAMNGVFVVVPRDAFFYIQKKGDSMLICREDEEMSEMRKACSFAGQPLLDSDWPLKWGAGELRRISRLDLTLAQKLKQKGVYETFQCQRTKRIYAGDITLNASGLVVVESQEHDGYIRCMAIHAKYQDGHTCYLRTLSSDSLEVCTRGVNTSLGPGVRHVTPYPPYTRF